MILKSAEDIEETAKYLAHMSAEDQAAFFNAFAATVWEGPVFTAGCKLADIAHRLSAGALSVFGRLTP